MNPKHLHVDQRLLGRCAYCGGAPGTRDHSPSKMLLDDPLPADLPVVDACATCNQSFSRDEEYFACFVECVLVGSTSLEKIQRLKVRRALERNTKLAAQIQSSASTAADGTLRWTPSTNQVRNVVLKLARGHAAFELSQNQLEDPVGFWCQPLSTLSADQREDFEGDQREDFEGAAVVQLAGWPEVNSRAFYRAAGAHPYADAQGPWIDVQPFRYRYSVESGGVKVKIVMSEYLACVVLWE